MRDVALSIIEPQRQDADTLLLEIVLRINTKKSHPEVSQSAGNDMRNSFAIIVCYCDDGEVMRVVTLFHTI